jgi:enamine deaminase RidA (YjgF/YER057c/UK114 family)
MDRPKFVVPSGYGVRQRDNYHYSQAVKIGNRVETSGQGGWSDDFEFPDDLGREIDVAFNNLERVLKEAGASWADVVAVNSYHVAYTEDVNQMMTAQFRKRMPSHCPIWTAIGVPALGAGPRMRVEVRVTAIIADEG